ncbi:hypothetical protein LX32DRAFT_207712 [Colletotrichum zoysiae]|uniref:Uncharacterized protein n=1 Tax=Colletotrichum zoysiae TaxID=1216348 RepID=A0AAD9HNH9_9PEZI|nr:hypothetical protein LX32DRAFT_207712 [Colletotrichum zoysiae]
MTVEIRSIGPFAFANEMPKDAPRDVTGPPQSQRHGVVPRCRRPNKLPPPPLLQREPKGSFFFNCARRPEAFRSKGRGHQSHSCQTSEPGSKPSQTSSNQTRQAPGGEKMERERERERGTQGREGEASRFEQENSPRKHVEELGARRRGGTRVEQSVLR